MLDFNVRSHNHNILINAAAAVAAVEGVFLYTKGVSVPRNVTRVRIHHSVLHIPLHAFSGCTTLVEVELHAGLRMIGEMAFYRCISLLRIIIPSSVSDILYGAFAYCGFLRNVTISSTSAITQEEFASSFPTLRKKKIALELIKGTL